MWRWHREIKNHESMKQFFGSTKRKERKTFLWERKKCKIYEWNPWTTFGSHGYNKFSLSFSLSPNFTRLALCLSFSRSHFAKKRKRKIDTYEIYPQNAPGKILSHLHLLIELQRCHEKGKEAVPWVLTGEREKKNFFCLSDSLPNNSIFGSVKQLLCLFVRFLINHAVHFIIPKHN